MNRRRRSFVRFILMAIDGAILILTYILTYIFRNRLTFLGLEDLYEFSYYFPYMGITLVLWLLLLRLFKNYEFLRGGRRAILRIFTNLLPAEALGLALTAMVLFFLREKGISRTFLVLFAANSYIALAVFKIFAVVYFRSMGREKRYHRKALLVGNKAATENFLALQDRMPEMLFDITTRKEFISDSYKPAMNEDILSYVWNNVADEVIVAYPDINLTDLGPLISGCARMGIAVNVVLDTTGIECQKIEVDAVGNFNIVSFLNFDYPPIQRFVKRMMDIAAGLLGSAVFLILYVFIAPIIKATSPGPVLFSQVRKGKNGREFRLFKFRTMYADAEERKKDLLAKNEMQGQIFKLKDDPRITPVGRFLRKASLDEWPQFMNILRGEMSLVGTRPPTREEFEKYEPHHRRRLSVQPGLTGMWQVSGRNEISNFEDVVKLDTWYIDHWSIWLDLKIILKTFLVVFSGR